MKNRATANSVDRHTVDEISRLFSSAQPAREKTEGVRVNSGIPHPSDLGPDRNRITDWDEWNKVVREAESIWRSYEHNG